MCKTRTKGVQANGAFPAPSGSSDECSQMRKGVREKRTLSNMSVGEKMLTFLQRQSPFVVALLACSPASLPTQGPSSLHTWLCYKDLPLRDAFLHLISHRQVEESKCPTLPLIINHTHRQHHGSLRGFHGDRMQALTSVNVIRALGLVCETGLISPPVGSLWSRPYLGFVH